MKWYGIFNWTVLTVAFYLGTATASDIQQRLENFKFPELKAKREIDPLVGIWSFETNDGSPHTTKGTVSVWKKHDIYVVHWSGIADTDDGFASVLLIGYGIREGDVFSVSWRTGDTHGISVFKIGDGRLTGRWIGSGSGQVHKEDWYFLRAHVKGV